MPILQVASHSASLFVTAIAQASIAAMRFLLLCLKRAPYAMFKALSQELIYISLIKLATYVFVFQVNLSKNLIYFSSSNLHSFFSAKKSYMMWAPNL